MKDSDWDIRRSGRAWSGGEAHRRYRLTPEKLEMVEGKLLWSRRERVKLLGLLLENVGADRAVRLGSAEVWREALAARKDWGMESTQQTRPPSARHPRRVL